MSSLTIPSAAREFFAELSANNNRDWYLEHKSLYDKAVRAPFVSLLEEVSSRLALEGLQLSGGAHTVFRLNRDVRFSPDKSPYKTHIAAVINESGSKNPAEPLVYVHLDSTGGFLAAGLWQPDNEKLRVFRNRMIEDSSEFSGLLDALSDSELELDRSHSTKVMPRGFADYASHPHADFVKLKNLIVRNELTSDQWTQEGIVEDVVDFVRRALPLLRYLHS